MWSVDPNNLPTDTAIAFMAGHREFFVRLDGKAVEKTINQALQTTIANIFAIFVEMSLLGGIGIAYNQILWTRFRQTAMRAAVIDNLITLVASPWNVLRVTNLPRAPLAWMVAVLAALTPFAAMFPPGALEVEFTNAVPLTMQNVPTMNISDYGNGTYQQFVEHSLFEMNGDLSFMLVLSFL